MHNSLLNVTLLSSASSAVDLLGWELWTLGLECSLEQLQLVPLGQPAIQQTRTDVNVPIKIWITL